MGDITASLGRAGARKWLGGGKLKIFTAVGKYLLAAALLLVVRCGEDCSRAVRGGLPGRTSLPSSAQGTGTRELGENATWSLRLTFYLGLLSMSKCRKPNFTVALNIIFPFLIKELKSKRNCHPLITNKKKGTE